MVGGARTGRRGRSLQSGSRVAIGPGGLMGGLVSLGVVLVCSAMLSGLSAVVDAGARRARRRTWSALRTTRLAPLVVFQQHFRFNLPRLTTATGMTLLLGIAAARFDLVVAGHAPVRVLVGLAVIGGVAALSALTMVLGRHPALVRTAWGVGSLVALASLILYLVSHTLGLPGTIPHAGRWEDPLGTFAMALSVSYLGLQAAILTKVTVAYPDRQRWHD